MRYWKAAYDEDLQRLLELRRRAGLPAADDEEREMWLFRLLVAVQVLLITLVGLLFVTSR
ncbi:MAG: hypothetical protein ACXVZV_06405 [Terriglobales bacterium]